MIKCSNFYKITFLIGGQDKVVTKWLNLWPYEHQFHFSKGIFVFYWSNLETLLKEVFYWRSWTGCDKMTLFVTKWIHISFSEGIFIFNWSNVESFLKEVFWLELRKRLWQNDLICDQMNTYLIFLRALLYSIDQM